jgi:multidrug efflux system outer membrane protein
VSSYQEALSLATASYRDGASSLLDVLDAQRNVSDAQSQLATAIQQAAQDYVALSVALGGGYAVGQTATSKGGPTIAAAVAAKRM